MVWFSHFLKNFPWFIVIHTFKGFSVVSEAKVDFFFEFSCFLYDPSDVCFLYDPTDVGNLICGSSVFSKSSCAVNPSLKDPEHRVRVRVRVYG